MYDPMNLYRGRYREYIESIMEKRPLNEKFNYSDLHHIVPKNDECKGKDESDNLIYLSYSEHFLAHKILVEENPGIKKLAIAFFFMCNCNPEFCTPEEYEFGRKAHIEAMTGRTYSWSHPASEEFRIKRSEYMQSEKNPQKNPEVKEKTRLRMLGNTQGLGNSGNYHPRSEEWKIHHSKLLTGRSRHGLRYHLVCEICNREYEATGSKQKYCPNCKIKMQKEYEATIPLKYHLVCKNCNKDYLGRSSRQKYCDVCRYELGV